ncbi:probable Ufm1-specific protease 1 [Scaptodrosophila lebanonensis]|uniref:Probable Ufm1-specific protease 1 n=1 Tax=Drosophila lebanonensis TaxID=7225 RepID=A0A6J2TM52_DROLE|nr:probable Ufm1-specific protease 1 [Scaptodrosophila lebanonensis]
MTTCEGDTERDDAVDQNRPMRVTIVAKTYNYHLHEDVHLALPPPATDGETLYTRGCFSYFHYGCDGTQDAGWGCGYRTLQSAISWIINKRGTANGEPDHFVPSIKEIQQMLVSIGDKSAPFVGSKEWIGTLEEFYVIDVMFELPCKILHSQQMGVDQLVEQIRKYFEEYGGFITMGGMSDTASKGIAGIHQGPRGIFLLIVDPHYVGVPASKQQIINQGFVRWMHINEFQTSSYNLCLILQR